MKQAVFIYSEEELKYKFHDAHPFNQQRLVLTIDLLREAAALHDGQIVPPRRAETDELLLAHSPSYVEAVQALSRLHPDQAWVNKAGQYGLGSGDTPYFPGIHEISATLAGGSLVAAESVMSGTSRHALHLGGGLHHALQGKASGFCVYNDVSIAIAYIKRQYQARVLYIDTDVHHGDGVQWSFYGDPDVCTFSIHETGKYLFPGTGGIRERGDGEAFGTCFNLPLEPYTEDDSWLSCFHETVEAVAARFKPDVIVSQHGCDAHAFDPLAHMRCSMRIYLEIPLRIQQLANRWCQGRWIALGGGGYDIWRVVPRAWSLLWLVMNGHPLIENIQKEPLHPLPQSWIERWQPHSPRELPQTWLDPTQTWPPVPRRQHIEAANQSAKERILLYLQ